MLIEERVIGEEWGDRRLGGGFARSTIQVLYPLQIPRLGGEEKREELQSTSHEEYIQSAVKQSQNRLAI